MGPIADQRGFGGRWRFNMVEGRRDMIVQLNPDSSSEVMDCAPFDEPEFTTTTTTTTTTTEGRHELSWNITK